MRSCGKRARLSCRRSSTAADRYRCVHRFLSRRVWSRAGLLPPDGVRSADRCKLVLCAEGSKPGSAESVRCEMGCADPGHLFRESRAVWGAEDVEALGTLYPEGRAARCTVERRMRALGLAGVGNECTTRTTRRARGASHPGDKLERDFTVDPPNEKWVADNHVCVDVVALRMRRFRDGSVFACDCRVERGYFFAHEPGVECVGACDAGEGSTRSICSWCHSLFRQGFALYIDCVREASGRGWH